MINEIIQGDCLEEAAHIESGSVDLILTDLPYGTMAGIDKGYVGYGRKKGDGHAWDMAIDPAKVYEIANRVLRKNGKMVLFSQEPYTTRMISGAIPNIPFSYRMVWEKDAFANHLLAKKAPVSYYEDVLVFSKASPKHDFEGFHPLRPYFAYVFNYIGTTKKAIIDKIGQRADHVFRTNSTQFSLCTEQTYNDLVLLYKIDLMEGFKSYDELQQADIDYRVELIHETNAKYPSVFNLWEGGKYKSNILRYKKDYSGFHPTQKPLLLLEDLIKTFSNEGDKVVDLTAGSGSTLVAAINTRRNFIGIEQDAKYAEIANSRIMEALKVVQTLEPVRN